MFLRIDFQTSYINRENRSPHDPILFYPIPSARQKNPAPSPHLYAQTQTNTTTQ